MQIKRLPTFWCEYKQVENYPTVAPWHYIQKFIAPTYADLITMIKQAMLSWKKWRIETDHNTWICNYYTWWIEWYQFDYYMISPTPAYNRKIDYPHYFICSSEYPSWYIEKEYIAYICFIKKDLLP